jgi:hypothetical protein
MSVCMDMVYVCMDFMSVRTVCLYVCMDMVFRVWGNVCMYSWTYVYVYSYPYIYVTS